MKLIHYLLVEDNEGDILLTTEILEEGKGIRKVTVIRDGKSALDFFDGLQHGDRPDLVLLDINLPKKSGHEVLLYIKTSENYNQIPVIMLTTSSSREDILLAYKNCANCFVTKPVEYTDFVAVITKISDFWTNIASIPNT